MKATYKVTNRLLIEIDEDSQADLFSGLASANEVFGHSECGACKSENIGYRVRTVDGNDFFEMMCKECRAVLSFGQHQNKSKTLFPHRKHKDGTFKKNNGWEKYVPPAKDAAAS